MNEDLVIKKLAEHDKRFDELVTKPEFQDFKHQVFNAQDQMLTILKRLDEERIFTTAWIQRIENEITAIKAHLKLS